MSLQEQGGKCEVSWELWDSFALNFNSGAGLGLPQHARWTCSPCRGEVGVHLLIHGSPRVRQFQQRSSGPGVPSPAAPLSLCKRPVPGPPRPSGWQASEAEQWRANGIECFHGVETLFDITISPISAATFHKTCGVLHLFMIGPHHWNWAKRSAQKNRHRDHGWSS